MTDIPKGNTVYYSFGGYVGRGTLHCVDSCHVFLWVSGHESPIQVSLGQVLFVKSADTKTLMEVAYESAKQAQS